MTAQDPFTTLRQFPRKSPYVRNWSSTYNHSPALFFAPVSVEEVKLIFREAAAQGKKVRVVGEHASPGPIWHGEWLISTQHFKTVSIDSHSRLAILGAGVPLHAANPLLAAHNLAFPVIGSIDRVSTGAYFSGPDHGSSAAWGVCANFARRVRVVTPRGEDRWVGRGEELYRAAGAGVGSCGVVVEVEWELVEACGLEVTMERVRLADYLKDGTGRALFDLAKSREYVKIWHFPHTLPFPLNQTDTILWRARRVPLPPPTKPTLFATFTSFMTRIVHGLAMLVTLYLFPGLQGWVNGLLYWSKAARLPAVEVKRSYEAQSMDCLYNQLVDEWTVPFPSPSSLSSIPSPSTTSNSSLIPPHLAAPNPTITALRSLLHYLTRTPEGKALGMHAPIEIRFNRAEKTGEGEGFYLSPGAGVVREGEREEGERQGEDDLVLWIEPIVYRPLNLPTPPRFYSFFTFFESLLRAPSILGRPHWCKAHFPSSRAEVERMFGAENVDAFHKARKEADPRGVMWTRWVGERVPGGSGEGEGRTVHRESEREGKRSRRYGDVMGEEA
ncbi:hypothetical protein JCM6882_004341 [Rhodosporidiobolus microsporus]